MTAYFVTTQRSHGPNVTVSQKQLALEGNGSIGVLRPGREARIVSESRPTRARLNENGIRVASKAGTRAVQAETQHFSRSPTPTLWQEGRRERGTSREGSRIT